METGEPIPAAPSASHAPARRAPDARRAAGPSAHARQPDQRGRAVTMAALCAALAVSPLALAQATMPTTLPASAPEFDSYREDLDTALRLTSPAAVALAGDVESARHALERTRLGLSAAGSLTPAAEYERDLAKPAHGAWGVDLELELSGAYSFDRGAVLRATLALERAEARLRAQLRGDVERALLALSNARLAARALADAREDASAAASLLAAALAEGSQGALVESLTLRAELAAIDLEREQLQFRDADAALAELGLYRAAAPPTQGVAVGDVVGLVASPSPELAAADQAFGRTVPDARLLALELQLAEQALSLVPFGVVRELELYGAYQAAGLEAGARLALAQGVPGAEVSLGWQLGDDDNVITFGVSATFQLTNTSPDETRVAQSKVDDAKASVAGFAAAWPDSERQGRALAELAYREFVVERRLQALAEAGLAELAGGAEGRDREAATVAVRRARDATERAWQRYIRALGDHLDVIDVVVRPD